MVLFGAYHSAERFFDDDRLTAHFPGPGSYALGSTVLVEGGVRYARKLVEDGVARPDGSPIVFRERDSWVRGKEGPQGLTSLPVGNNFVSPATYSTESGERATRETRAPAAVVHTLEPRYLSPSTRCLTPDHERAAKGEQSPGPGTYYPSFEAWDFAPPEEWNPVNKAATACRRTPRSRRFNTKVAWGEPTVPRPPDPSRAAQKPTEDERAWLSEKRGPIRPRTSPRCMWVHGVCTRRGLQAWGDVATTTGPLHVGYRGDCCSPRWDQQNSSRRGPGSKSSGPVYSCEARATSPGFREARYLDRDLMRRCGGTALDTPGPGEYDVRVPLRRGTSFAGPRPRSSKAAAAGAFLASAKLAVASNERAAVQGRRGSSSARRRSWPSPPAAARSQRLSAPLMGRESPGPAYNLPSDFDRKLVNKKTFHPPGCGGTKPNRGEPRKRRRSAPRCREVTITGLRRELSDLVANTGGGVAGKASGRRAAGKALGVPVSTSLGRGFLLRIRDDGTTFVRLPWGVLYTKEVLTHGNGFSGRESVGLGEDPSAADPSVGDHEPAIAAAGAVERADALPVQEGGEHTHDEHNTPRPTGEGSQGTGASRQLD